MKLFFISDIHGSLYYGKKAIEKFKEHNADYLVILGDHLYHGARNPLSVEYNPKETAELFNQYSDRIISVRGNCDSEVDEAVLDFPISSDYAFVLYEGRRLFLTHGHIYNEENLPKLKAGDVFFYGHTHLPVAKKQNDIYIINPGSITLPKGGNPNSYAVLENSHLKIMDLEDNIIKEIIF